MSRRRRSCIGSLFYSSRGTHNAIHFLTALVVASIFLSESWLKEQSVLHTAPFKRGGRKIYANGRTRTSPDNFARSDELESESSKENPVYVHGQAVIPDGDKLEERIIRSGKSALEKQVTASGLKLHQGVSEHSSNISGRIPVTQPPSTTTVRLSTTKPIAAFIPTIQLSTLNQKNNTNQTEATHKSIYVNLTGNFKGVTRTPENDVLFKVENITQLSLMLYRIIKTHEIRSVLDVPCSLSTLWTAHMLRVLEFEVPGFHYRCLTPDDITLAQAILKLQDLESVIVLKDSTPWASKLPRADLAFVWDGIGYLPPAHSWKLIKALVAAKTKYVIVPNYPTVRKNSGSGSKTGRINVRRAPYRFNEPLRVINNISLEEGVVKQMLLYGVSNIKS